MKKVINILVKRKSEIDKEFQEMPKEVDQYIAEIASELQEEERQIDQALLVLSFGRLAFVTNFGTQIFHLKTKFDMEKNTSTNHENGNDANRLLAAVDFNSPENQNRDKAIIGYDPVLKCKCEMPAKIHGKNLCWRCKRSLSLGRGGY